MSAAAPTDPPPAASPTVALAWCHAYQRRDLLARARPQRGECQQQCPGTHGANPRGTRHQVIVCPPQWASPAQRLAVVVQRGDIRLAPRQRGHTILRKARARPRQAVLLRGPQDEQWLAAPHQGSQLLRLGGGPRPGRRAAHVGTGGQGAGRPASVVANGPVARAPSPACRGCTTTTLYGLAGVQDVTPHAPLRSPWTQARSVCHVRGLGDGDAPTSLTKDTRLEGVGW